MTEQRVNRRDVCCGVATAGGAVLAGCLGSDGGDDEERVVPDELKFGSVELNPSFPVELYESDNAELGERVTFSQHHETNTHWHCQPVKISYQSEHPLIVAVNNVDNELIELGSDGPLRIGYQLGDGTTDAPFTVEIEGDQATFVGENREQGTIAFDIKHDGEVGWSTPPLEIAVVDPENAINSC